MKRNSMAFCMLTILLFGTASLHAQERYPTTQLTSDSTQEGFPSWSPDGQTIVYSFFNIIDGRRIAFASGRTGRGDIYIMEIDAERVKADLKLLNH